MNKIKVGNAVEWAWGAGHVEGQVIGVFERTIRRTIKGKQITRHGTVANPAYLIRTTKGVPVLKLGSEIKLCSTFADYKSPKLKAPPRGEE